MEILATANGFTNTYPKILERGDLICRTGLSNLNLPIAKVLGSIKERRTFPDKNTKFMKKKEN